jgi:hypothetical protein
VAPTAAIAARFAGLLGPMTLRPRPQQRPRRALWAAPVLVGRVEIILVIAVRGRVVANFAVAPAVALAVVIIAVAPGVKVVTRVAKAPLVTRAVKVAKVAKVAKAVMEAMVAVEPRKIAALTTVPITASRFTQKTRASTRWCKPSGSLVGRSNCLKLRVRWWRKQTAS